LAGTVIVAMVISGLKKKRKRLDTDSSSEAEMVEVVASAHLPELEALYKDQGDIIAWRVSPFFFFFFFFF